MNATPINPHPKRAAPAASAREHARYAARMWANAAAESKPRSKDERRAVRGMFDGLYAMLGRHA